jgi:hypothetical protein
MSKLYVNGWGDPSFEVRLRTTGALLVPRIDLSFKYEALKEYYERITTLAKFTDGSKSKKSHYIEYEWRLFYTGRIDNPDFLKLREIENYDITQDDERQPLDIWLIPHRQDAAHRKFKVMTIDEKREYEIFPHFGGQDNTPMMGYEIAFMNKEPIVFVDIWDPNGVEATYGGEPEEVVGGQVQVP